MGTSQLVTQRMNTGSDLVIIRTFSYLALQQEAADVIHSLIIKMSHFKRPENSQIQKFFFLKKNKFKR